MKHFKKILILFVLLTSHLCSFSQVGIGTTTPNASSALDITSTTGGMLIPRMTQVQRLAIGTPANGLLVYQNNLTAGFYYWDGTVWKTFGGGSGWALTGDSGTTAGTNFIGTTDANGLNISTNNTERIRVNATGLIGIGTTSPTEELHLVGTSPVFRFQDGNEGVNKILKSDANGNAYWANTTAATGADDDWRFLSGSGFADPAYHTGGNVVIGRIGTSTHTLDVDNGIGTTTLGIGDVEYFQEGNNEIRVSHSLVKAPGAAYSTLGNIGPTLEWNTIYTINNANTPSDKKFKKDIHDLNYGLEELMQLNPISYKWNEVTIGSVNLPLEERELKLGFIAQEVEKIIPETVISHSLKKNGESETDKFEYTKNDLLSMNYEALLPLIVKAKQEQHQRIIKLQNENNALLKKVEELNAKQK
ncbi:tail fiber domain-containing protein [Flavobacterium sp. F372]|uniref:Tail fiber domain-containing protein n=1 Tax=Flavobacterium bernardetii TaxID=2813823 RepID=A0ABR7IY49_9FLAO|nr:tail fiber domain-containing protein [Flavobacterium bernardetii]MBC5834701.1 tail fiber domain-containing protein [Flavobacterium bernardetii]NHF70349.1 tail fiber domain-containing protein [Flavobacterium bernardetii]